MKKIEQELAKMSSRQLVAYWNLLQSSKTADLLMPHEDAVHALLTARNVPHQVGKLTGFIGKQAVVKGAR